MTATTDGGATWTAQTAPTGSFSPGQRAFTGVSFVDRSRGWVVSLEAVYLTVDGGRSWSLSYRDVPETDELWGIDFVDHYHGWVAGFDDGYPVVLQTIDGGRTWASRRTGGGSSASAVAVDFVDPLNGWVVSGNKVRVTSDGGATWRGQPIPTDYDVVDLNVVSFSDTRHGHVAGRQTYRDDGGNTWVRHDPALGGLRDVVAVGATHVRATVDGNTVLTSDDAGRTWARHRTAVTTDQTLNGVDFADAGRGWVVGDGGVIRRTDDAGVTWVDQGSGTTDPLADVMFHDRMHGAAVGGLSSSADSRRGVILTTADGGDTWTSRFPASTLASPFTGVFFLDPARGWVAGGDGLLATTDGGRTWARRGPFTSARDDGSGWAVGWLGTVVSALGSTGPRSGCRPPRHPPPAGRSCWR